MSMNHLLPVPAHLALALIVNKSKPAESSITDYITQLRQTIVKQPPIIDVRNQQYIDGTLFWKRACEKLEEDKNELQNKIFELEQRPVFPLQQQHQQQNQNVQSITTRSPKPESKSEPRQNVKANTQTKRRRLEHSHVEISSDNDLESRTTDTASGQRTLLRVFTDLQTVSHESSIKQEKLFRSIKIACHTAVKYIVESCQTQDTHTKSHGATPSPCEVFNIIRKIWTLTLESLTNLHKGSEPITGRPSCLPDIIFLFLTLLNQLRRSSLTEADEDIQTRKRRKSRSSKTISLTHHLSDQRKTICEALTTTMCTMLARLEMTTPLHQLIYEGMMCALLDHVGSSLSFMVFEDTSAKKHDPGLLTPKGLLDNSHIDKEVAQTTVQLSSPYLIQLLCKARQVIKVDSSASPDELRSASTVNEPTSLRANIEARLQSTLLRGVFGDEDESFKDSLQRPDEPVEAKLEELVTPSMHEVGSSDWFIEQVWENLGWDILAKIGLK